MFDFVKSLTWSYSFVSKCPLNVGHSLYYNFILHLRYKILYIEFNCCKTKPVQEFKISSCFFKSNYQEMHIYHSFHNEKDTYPCIWWFIWNLWRFAIIHCCWINHLNDSFINKYQDILCVWVFNDVVVDSVM